MRLLCTARVNCRVTPDQPCEAGRNCRVGCGAHDGDGGSVRLRAAEACEGSARRRAAQQRKHVRRALTAVAAVELAEGGGQCGGRAAGEEHAQVLSRDAMPGQALELLRQRVCKRHERRGLCVFPASVWLGLTGTVWGGRWHLAGLAVLQRGRARRRSSSTGKHERSNLSAARRYGRRAVQPRGAAGALAVPRGNLCGRACKQNTRQAQTAPRTATQRK